MESRQDYLYVGTDGELHDARQEEAAYNAMAKMHEMAEEGLISKAFMDASEENSGTYLENDMGFMSYDYNQTQTIMNATKLQEGEKYMAVMVPVARWYDGTDENGVYMRFTESWRSVKTDGWAISKAGVESDEAKLNAALALIDYAYSEKGQILMSYGPDAFIKTKDDGSYETFNFNGKEMPVIADATYEELWEKANGNYTNYARHVPGLHPVLREEPGLRVSVHPRGRQGRRRPHLHRHRPGHHQASRAGHHRESLVHLRAHRAAQHQGGERRAEQLHRADRQRQVLLWARAARTCSWTSS